MILKLVKENFMKFNSTTLVGLLVLSSSLALQALSPAQVRTLVNEGSTAIKKGNPELARRKIQELKKSGNSGAAIALERELLETSLDQLKYTKNSLQIAKERLAAGSKSGKASKKEIAEQQRRIDELENLLLDTARETSELEQLFRNAVKDLEALQKPAPYSAGVEPADDNVVRAAKIALDKDLKRVIGNTDVHSLWQITSPDNFSYLDYLYWRRSIGWNARMTYLYWADPKLYKELGDKYKEYSERFNEEKDRGSRVFKEAAMTYLADLETSGLGKYSARQILPQHELWKYLRAEEEVARYIDEVRKINAKKADEVVAIARKYREEFEAEEARAREERDKAHAEMNAEAAKHTKEEVDQAQEEVQNKFGSTIAERLEEASAPA